MASNDERLSLLSDKIDLSLATISSHNDVTKLKELLRQESRCHQETGDCYETLQKEYDSLLFKYAEAENTIDQLRIGARVDLYSNSPKINFAVPGEFHERSKSVQQIPLPRPQSAHMSRAKSLPGRNDNVDSQSLIPEETTEASRLNLYLRLRDLQDDVLAFQGSLYENEYEDEEKKDLYDVIKAEYEKIKTELENVHHIENPNQTSSLEDHEPNSLEVEVHQLGLRLEEINDEISEQIRSKQRNSQRLMRNTPEIINSTTGNKNTDNIENDVFIPKPYNQLKHDIKGDTWIAGMEDVTSSNQHRSSLSPSKADSLDAKYLLQSLGADDKFSRSSANHPVASWLHSEKHSVNSGRKHSINTGRSTGKKITSPSRERLSIPISKQTPDKRLDVQNRPNTMNSTEDSGFIESERQRQSPQRVIPINQRMVLSHHSESPMNFNGGDAVSETSAGEMYRQRLDSLRDFIHHKRNSNTCSPSTKYRKDTPRSWVRGIPSKTISPPVLMSEQLDVSLQEQSAMDRHRRNYHLKASNHSSPISPDTSPGHGRSEFSKSPNVISLYKSQRSPYQTPRRESHFNEVTPDRHMVDALYEEMQQIRDLVTDVRESLPTETTRQAKSHTWNGEKSPLTERVASQYQENNVQHQSFQNQRQKIDEKENEPLLGKQLQTLNKKLDHLSNKLDSKLSRASSMSSLTSRSTRTSSRSRSVSTESVKTQNLPNEQLQRLERLSSKLEELSASIQNSTKSNLESSSKRREKELLGTIETKLSDVHKQISDRPSTTTQLIPTDSCFNCKQQAKHSHGDDRFDFNSRTTILPEKYEDVDHKAKEANWFTSTPLSRPYNGIQFASPVDDPPVIHSSDQSASKEHLTNSNVFHHYHTFCHTPSQDAGTLNKEKLDKGIQKRPSRERLAIDYDHILHDGIMNASYAAQKMENMSRKMLRNIASDLFNSGPSEI